MASSSLAHFLRIIHELLASNRLLSPRSIMGGFVMRSCELFAKRSKSCPSDATWPQGFCVVSHRFRASNRSIFPTTLRLSPHRSLPAPGDRSGNLTPCRKDIGLSLSELPRRGSLLTDSSKTLLPF